MMRNPNRLNQERDRIEGDESIGLYAKSRLKRDAARLDAELRVIGKTIESMGGILAQHGVEHLESIKLLSYFMGDLFKPEELKEIQRKMEAWPKAMEADKASAALVRLGAFNKAFVRALDGSSYRRYLGPSKRRPQFIEEATRNPEDKPSARKASGSPS